MSETKPHEMAHDAADEAKAGNAENESKFRDSTANPRMGSERLTSHAPVDPQVSCFDCGDAPVEPPEPLAAEVALPHIDIGRLILEREDALKRAEAAEKLAAEMARQMEAANGKREAAERSLVMAIEEQGRQFKLRKEAQLLHDKHCYHMDSDSCVPPWRATTGGKP